MKKFIAIALFAFICLPVFALPSFVLALSGSAGGGNGNVGTEGSAGGGNGNTGTANPNTITWGITNPLRIGSDIPSIITAVLQNIVMPLASVLVVLAILYSGFKFVIAQGKPKEIEEARSGLLWVLIGALVLLGATGISAALKSTVDSIIK